MGKQHNRRIFAGFYKRYDGKFIYVVAVVPDVDTGEQVVIFHEGIDACECKYYSLDAIVALPWAVSTFA